MESLIIRDEAQRLIPMRFSDSQNLLWRFVAPQLDAGEKLWFVVLKGRQVYATTFFEALAFVRTIEQPNTNSLIIGQDLFSASEIFGIARRFWEHLPLPKLKPSKVKELEFPFPGGASRFRVVSAGNIAKGRGTTQSCVHASEVAFWPQPEVIGGLIQAVPDLPDTLWVMESTANGMVGNGRAFYDAWKAAVDGRSALIPVFIPWFTMPKYRIVTPLGDADWDEEEKLLLEQFRDRGLDAEALAWRRYAIATKCQGSTELFKQEYPSAPEEAFLSTGLPAFEWTAILRQQQHIVEAQLQGVMDQSRPQRQPNGWLRLWQSPRAGHQYVIGVDTSEGIRGGDYACAQVLDMNDMEQVALLHGFISPWDLANQLAQLGTYYRQALIAVEVLGSGWAVQDYLLRVLAYPNLHVWRGRADQIRFTPGRLFGWVTNVFSRPLLIEAGRRAINSGSVIIHDRSTLDEISKFSRADTGRYQAEIGHDDRVMALLIALRSREENYGPASRVITPPTDALSAPNPSGVRIIAPAEGLFHLKRKVHQELAGRAKRAVKTWLEM
jgi:hypothetical protein